MVAGSRRRGAAAVVVVVLVGLLATAFGTWAAAQLANTHHEREADAAAAGVDEALTMRVSRYEAALTQLRNHLQVVDAIRREDVLAFIGLGRADGLFDDTQAVAFARHVPSASLAAYEQQVRDDLARDGVDDDFGVHPAADPTATDHFVVEILSPLTDNGEAYGFDIGSDPTRRAALEAARDTGEVVATAPINLVTDRAVPDGSRGFLLVQAVYDTAAIPADVPSRRDQVSGYAVIAFRADDLAAAVVASSGVSALDIRDVGPAATAPTTDVDLQGDLLVDTTAPADADTVADPRVIEVDVADRRWIARVQVGDTLDDPSTLLPLGTAAGGLAITLLLGTVVHLVMRSRRRALLLASDRAGALRGAEARFRLLVEHSPDALLVVDASERIDLASRRILDLTGYPPEALLDTPISDLLPDGLPDVAASADSSPVTATLQHADGHEVPIEITVAPVDAGDDQFVIAALRDATVRHQIDEALRHALERKSLANRQFEQAHLLQSRFLESVSHELRTPLTGVIGFTDHLLTYHPDMPAEQRGMLGRVSRNAHLLAAMITDLLDLNQLDAATTDSEATPVELQEAAHALRDRLRPRLDDHTIEVSGVAVTALADPSLLARVLDNVVTNAVSYSPPDTPIRVEVGDDDGVAVIRVSDEGPGIPEFEQALVFQRFYRGRDRAVMAVPGSGIGLSVARALLDLQGGTIHVVSPVHGGTTIEIRLPLAHPLGDAAPGEDAPTPAGISS